MDRCLLEACPTVYLRLAGAARAVGNGGYIYVRTEYPLAVERLKVA